MKQFIFVINCLYRANRKHKQKFRVILLTKWINVFLKQNTELAILKKKYQDIQGLLKKEQVGVLRLLFDHLSSIKRER